MKCSMIMLIVLLIGIVAIASFGQTTPPVSAGGWPCFTCHGGVNASGTDLAPPLAGSKLTDDQIIAQVRRPRGVMPAFSVTEISDQNLKDGFIQPFMRGLPAGQPTAALAPPIRAMALATIAAVAQTRSAEYANIGLPTGVSTPTPVPTAMRNITVDSNFDERVIATIGGLLGMVIVGAWVGWKILPR